MNYKNAAPTLFRDRWTASNPSLEDAIADVNADELATEYRKLKCIAPRRRKNSYFSSGHDGKTTRLKPCTKRVQWEKRYAMALWNLKGRWPRPNGGRQRFLDYQVPLKATRADKGIGEIDLLGAAETGRFIVVELKSPRSSPGDSPKRAIGDSPMHALMEGLRYAAISGANLDTLASNASRRFGCGLDRQTPPIVQVLAPISWWRSWLNPDLKQQVTGNWNSAFARLATAFEGQTGVTIECMATDTCIEEVIDKLRQEKPSLGASPIFYAVHLGRNEDYFEQLPQVTS